MEQQLLCLALSMKLVTTFSLLTPTDDKQRISQFVLCLLLNQVIFLSYKVLVRVARAEAIAVRRSTVMICVLRREEDLSLYEDAINSLDAEKESVVTFGPWKAAVSVRDLLDCVKMDIESQGYKVDIQPHIREKSFLSKSYDFFYEVSFSWW